MVETRLENIKFELPSYLKDKEWFNPEYVSSMGWIPVTKITYRSLKPDERYSVHEDFGILPLREPTSFNFKDIVIFNDKKRKIGDIIIYTKFAILAGERLQAYRSGFHLPDGIIVHEPKPGNRHYLPKRRITDLDLLAA